MCYQIDEADFTTLAQVAATLELLADQVNGSAALVCRLLQTRLDFVLEGVSEATPAHGTRWAAPLANSGNTST